MSRYEQYKEYIDKYLESHSDTIAVNIDDGVRYIMAQQYIMGYNDGMFEVMETLNNASKAD